MTSNTFDPDTFVNELVEVAKRDGIVSDDERSLITVIEKEVRHYQNELEKSLDDGIITRQEKLVLLNKRLMLVRKVFDTVQKDLKITNDEQDLMDVLMKKLQEWAELERGKN